MMSRSTQRQTTKYDSALLYIERELDRTKNEHKKHIRHIHASAMMLADRLACSGDIQAALFFVDGVSNKKNATNTVVDENSTTFLEEQRFNLKKMCERNEKSMRTTDAFIWALTTVRDDLREMQSNEFEKMARQKQRSAHMESDGVIEVEVEDLDKYMVGMQEEQENYYEEIIRSKMTEYIQHQTNADVRTESSMVRKCIDRLGETVKEDEGLEVMNQPGGYTDSDLRCPITGRLFVKPVKNKVCGHAYDMEGLRQYIRSKERARKKCNCPIAGCKNAEVTLNQVEEDEEIELKVRRHKTRVERENQQRLTQEYEECEETIID